MQWVIKVPLAIVFLGLAVVSGLAAGTAFRSLATAWTSHWPLWLALVIGLTVGAWRWLAGFYRTLEHELTHVIFALLCFQPPRHMVVTHERGGEAGFAGSGNFIISLAPYFFPLTATVVAVVTALAADAWRGWLMLILVAALGYHVTVVAGELRVGQTDLSRHGTWFSATVIAALAVPLLAALFAFAVWGGPGLSVFGRAWLASGASEMAWLRSLKH